MATKEDYNAGQLALQVYDRIHPRSEFGRATTFIENAKWDNDRKVIAMYECGLMVDEPWKKSKREEFIKEAGLFLNSLQEAYHMKGYHIGMTGLTEGSIYVAKDNDTDPMEFNTSDGEYDYTQECAYRQYLMNKARCQKELKGMIIEAAILSDDELAISERVEKLYSINEGVGDSIKDAWGKFKAFIQKMWNKFLEFIARTVNTDRSYLEKYKDIILNRKWKGDSSIEVDAQYSVGITRLAQYTIVTPTADVVNRTMTKNDEQNLRTMQNIVMPEYKNAGTVDFKDYCKHWFKGGDGKSGRYTMSEGELNFTDMYNWCYNYDKVKRSLEKNQGIMNNAVTVFQNAAKETVAANATAAANKEEEKKKASPTPDPTSAQKTPSDPNKKQWKITYNGRAYYVTQADQQEFNNPATDQQTKETIINNNSSESFQDSTDVIDYYGKLGHIILEKIEYGAKGSGTSTASTSQMGNLTQSGGSVRQANDTAKKVTDTSEEDLVKKLGYYSAACGDVFAAMLTAAEGIKKDYMSLIKKHVQSYLGEDKDSDNKIAQRTGTDNTTTIKYDTELAYLGADGEPINGVKIGDKTYDLKKLADKEKNNQLSDDEKAEIQEFLHSISQTSSHTTPQGTVARTYGTLAEFIQAVKSYKEQKDAQATAQQQQ